MTEKLNGLIAQIRHLLLSRWGRRARLALAILVGGAALYRVGRQLWHGASAIEWSDMTPDWPLLGLALGWALISQFLGGVVWHLVLRALSHKLSVITCATIHSSSNLAKYIPGYAWQLLGKAYLTRQQKVPTRAITLGLAVEFGGLIVTALLAASLLLDPGLITLPVSPSPGLRLAGALMMACLLIAAPWLLRWIRQRRHDWSAHTVELGAGWLWSAFVVMLVAWLILGQSTSLIVRALARPVPGLWPASTSALALSFVVSFAVFFVPAGIGVRESALTWLLGPLVGGGVAALTAIISRLSLTLAELLAYALLWAIKTARYLHNRSITQRGESEIGLESPPEAKSNAK